MQKIKVQAQAKPTSRAKLKTQSKPKAAMNVAASPKRQRATSIAPPAKSTVPEPRPSKQAALRGLLQRKEGAGLAALMAATGWRAHSVRAVLSGLRKQGLIVTRTAGAEGGSVYRITGPASAQVKG